MLPWAWFYHQNRASHVVGLDSVEASDGCRPIGMDDPVVPQKDVAGRGHSLGELALIHGHLASWVEDLAVAGGEGGYWPPM
jgi:hypothetical protein